MDLVTFATRVCKLLGVETMIGMMNVTKLSGTKSDILRSYQRGGWAEPDVSRRRHCVFE
jgi:hypothetical protein